MTSISPAQVTVQLSNNGNNEIAIKIETVSFTAKNNVGNDDDAGTMIMITFNE